METMNTHPTLFSTLGIAALLLAACEMPLTGSGDKTTLITDTVYVAGTDTSRFDSLDAQAGKGRFNLIADAAGKGSILYSQKFLNHAEASDPLIGLSDHGGTELGIRTGDVLTVTVSAEAGSTAAVSIPITQGFTLADLAAAITAFLRGPAVDAGLGTTVEMVTPMDSEPLRGALTLYGNTSAPIRDFRITSNRPVTAPVVAMSFAVPADIPAGAVRMAATTSTLRAPARAADPMGELYDANGNGLGLESGDAIAFNGSLGGKPTRNAPPLIYAGGPAGTTLQAVMDGIKAVFKLAERDGSPGDHPSVSLNPAGSDDNIPDGSIVIRGEAGSASAIDELTVRSTDFNNAAPAPSIFNTNMNVTTLREATDDLILTTAQTVFDGSGGEQRDFHACPARNPVPWE